MLHLFHNLSRTTFIPWNLKKPARNLWSVTCYPYNMYSIPYRLKAFAETSAEFWVRWNSCLLNQEHVQRTVMPSVLVQLSTCTNRPSLKYPSISFKKCSAVKSALFKRPFCDKVFFVIILPSNNKKKLVLSIVLLNIRILIKCLINSSSLMHLEGVKLQKKSVSVLPVQKQLEAFVRHDNTMLNKFDLHDHLIFFLRHPVREILEIS